TDHFRRPCLRIPGRIHMVKTAVETAVEDVELLFVPTYEHGIAEPRSACLDQLKRTGALLCNAPVVNAVIATKGDDVDFALLRRKGSGVGDDEARHLLTFPGGPLKRGVHELVFRVSVEEVEVVHGSLDHCGNSDHRQASVLPAVRPVPPKAAVQ